MESFCVGLCLFRIVHFILYAYTELLWLTYMIITASWRSGYIAIGAIGLGFDYQACQIRLGVANGSPLLRRFLGAVLPWRLAAGMDLTSPHTLRCNIAGNAEYRSNKDLLFSA